MFVLDCTLVASIDAAGYEQDRDNGGDDAHNTLDILQPQQGSLFLHLLGYYWIGCAHSLLL